MDGGNVLLKQLNCIYILVIVGSFDSVFNVVLYRMKDINKCLLVMVIDFFLVICVSFSLFKKVIKLILIQIFIFDVGICCCFIEENCELVN